jgi:hypothetical protein
VLCCAVLCCAVLCCAVLCCAVLCCAVLCAGLTNVPMDLSMAAARVEFEAIAFGAVKDLLNKTGIQPRQIGIVITNSR